MGCFDTAASIPFQLSIVHDATRHFALRWVPSRLCTSVPLATPFVPTIRSTRGLPAALILRRRVHSPTRKNVTTKTHNQSPGDPGAIV